VWTHTIPGLMCSTYEQHTIVISQLKICSSYLTCHFSLTLYNTCRRYSIIRVIDKLSKSFVVDVMHLEFLNIKLVSFNPIHATKHVHEFISCQHTYFAGKINNCLTCIQKPDIFSNFYLRIKFQNPEMLALLLLQLHKFKRRKFFDMTAESLNSLTNGCCNC
jgi:hypothetical protein